MNSVAKINLSNLKHCNQIWTEMPENDLGRHCQKCSNTIIDFRNSTDSEIAQKHLFADSKVCGLYSKEQLQKPTKTSLASNKVNFNSICFASLSLLSSSTFAQENTEIITEQTELNLDSIISDVDFKYSETKSSANPLQSNNVVVSGKLTDENGEPLAWANVTVKGSSTYVSTDFDGIYKLNLNDEFNSESVTLIYSNIGFTTLEKIIDSKALKKNHIINVKLVEDFDSVTSFYVTAKLPFYKRVWYKFKNIFRN